MAILLILQARDPIEAIRLKPPRIAVIRRGRVISETTPLISRLDIDGRTGILIPLRMPACLACRSQDSVVRVPLPLYFDEV